MAFEKVNMQKKDDMLLTVFSTGDPVAPTRFSPSCAHLADYLILHSNINCTSSKNKKGKRGKRRKEGKKKERETNRRREREKKGERGRDEKERETVRKRRRVREGEDTPRMLV